MTGIQHDIMLISKPLNQRSQESLNDSQRKVARFKKRKVVKEKLR